MGRLRHMEIRLRSGKLIMVEEDRLDEIWKLRGFLTEEEMEQVEAEAGTKTSGEHCNSPSTMSVR